MLKLEHYISDQELSCVSELERLFLIPTVK